MRSIASLCSRVSSGGTPSRKHAEYYADGNDGIPWVKSKELVEVGIRATEECITAEGLQNSSAKLHPKNAVLMAMYGANVGQMGWLEVEATVNQAICAMIVDEGEAHWRYVFYSLQHHRADLVAKAHGAAQQNISQDLIKKFEIPVPDLPTQRRIAGILSAYDELIANNQRRIAILEEMARALYREWFVHYKAPGVVMGEGGVPEGWEVKTIAELCESVNYGYTASASSEEVGPKFLRITDIVPDQIDWMGVPFCEIPLDKQAKYLLQEGDIVVARTGATTGYAKRLNKFHPPTVYASYLVRARARSGVSNRMLGIVMESDEYKQFIATNIGGSAQPQANAVVLTSMPVVAPPSSAAAQFDRIVEPILDQAELLAVKNQNLRRTRDLLLPRLMSGRVELNTVEV